MQMADGIDTGDMLAKAETPIGEDETAGELFDRLMVLGAELLVRLVMDAGTDLLHKPDNVLCRRVEHIQTIEGNLHIVAQSPIHRNFDCLPVLITNHGEVDIFHVSKCLKTWVTFPILRDLNAAFGNDLQICQIALDCGKNFLGGHAELQRANSLMRRDDVAIHFDAPLVNSE